MPTDKPSGCVTPDDSQACENTDRELWREREGDYYADSIHVTERGGIGINCGGMVYVKPIREWHRLAKEASVVPSESGSSAMEQYAEREKLIADFVASSAGGTSVDQAVRDAYRSALTYAASLCESKVFDRQDAFDNGCWTCAESIKAELAAINRDNPGDTPVSATVRRPTPEMIEAGRLAIMGMLEPKRAVKPKPTIAELEAILNADNGPDINIEPDGSFTELTPRTTTAAEVAKTAYEAMVAADGATKHVADRQANKNTSTKEQ